MKKLYFIVLFICVTRIYTFAQMRYRDEVFTTLQFTKDSVYATNIQVLGGFNTTVSLKCDIYQPPAYDTVSKRPLIVLLHSGNFIPKYLNYAPSGFKDDSATTELAKGFARRGYVVCVPAYRLGWYPNAGLQESRAASYMQAVYRGEQDAKAAVRYMKWNAAIYKIDVNKIVLGGMGTGSTVALTYAYVHTNAETQLPKFIGSGGQPYIDVSILGDIDNLIPGSNSIPNNPGMSSDISMVFSLGGTIGDLSWMNAGEIPVVGFHSYSDPYDPDTVGIVTVSGNQIQTVITADGNRNLCRMADQLGLQVWKNCTFSDPYTLKSLVSNEGISGYYRFKIPYPSSFTAQASPWEWWDSATTVSMAFQAWKNVGTSDTVSSKNALFCHTNGKATNQFMSKSKARAYIDTIQNYLAPRIMVTLQLPGFKTLCPNGINNSVRQRESVIIYPNPVQQEFTVKTTEEIRNIVLTDLSGRIVLHHEGDSRKEFLIERNGIMNGIYIIHISTDNGEFIQRVILD